MLKARREIAQSTLEYILVLTAIVAIIIYAAATWFKPAIQRTLEKTDEAIGSAADRF